MAEDRATAAIADGGTPRRIIHGTLTYGLASVLQRAAPLLLLPLFALILSPDEFGQIGVILSLTAAFSTVAALGLETTIFRTYSQMRAANDQQITTFVNTVGGFGVVTPILMSVLALVLLGPVLAQGLQLPLPALALGTVAAAATAAATAVPLALLRAQERLRTYLALTSFQLLASGGLAILFVAVLRMGVAGWMLASAISAAVLLVRGLLMLDHMWSARFDVGLLSAALAFGLPLVPHALAQWGLAVSDRVILGAFVSGDVVGNYYIAYLVALPVTLVGVALSQALQPIHAVAGDSAEKLVRISRLVTPQVMAVALAAAAVALLGPPLVAIVLPAEFTPASDFIPWLALGALFFGLYLIPMSAVALTAGRTRGIWVVTIVAATTNIALNLLLVPRLGAMAAAIDTAIGYAVLLAGISIYMALVVRRRIPYEARRIIAGGALIAVATAVGFAASYPEPIVLLVVRAAVLAVVVLALATVGPMRAEARAMFGVLRPALGRVWQ